MTINGGIFVLQQVYNKQISKTWLLNFSIRPSFGWFGGGVNPAPATVSSIERYSHTNDTTNTEIRTSLSKSVRGFYATNNTNYGWYAAGLRTAPAPVAVVSQVERITFSSDTSSLSIRGDLSHTITDASASGNENYGWHAGGNIGGTTAPKSSIQRINYSEDTSISLTRGNLNTTVERQGATGNDSYGWFFGGLVNPFVPSLVWLSKVERITYSTDTATASLRGALNVVRVQPRAVSTANYGWIAGGNNLTASPITLTSICRIDFNSDTQTAVVRSNLTTNAQYMSYTNDANYGWFTLGNTSTGINRIEFLNDTTNAILRGFTQTALERTASTTGTT